jgi:hypothetical protein
LPQSQLFLLLLLLCRRSQSLRLLRLRQLPLPLVLLLQLEHKQRLLRRVRQRAPRSVQVRQLGLPRPELSNLLPSGPPLLRRALLRLALEHLGPAQSQALPRGLCRRGIAARWQPAIAVLFLT